jgi:hypothetical protein
MKASDATGCKTTQQQRHDIACNGSGIARHTSLRPALIRGHRGFALSGGFYIRLQ